MSKKQLKVRRFYPRQVLFRLNNRLTDSLDRAERHALMYFVFRGRAGRYNVTMIDGGRVRVTSGSGHAVLSGPAPARAIFTPGQLPFSNGEHVELYSSLAKQTLLTGSGSQVY